jgi:hypothetical protein
LRQARQGRTSFSEEKEAKRLLVLRALEMVSPRPAGAKVFWLLFFKKVTSFARCFRFCPRLIAKMLEESRGCEHSLA